MSTPDQAATEALGATPGADSPTAGECADYLDQIVYFIDNELDDADCAVVQLHLDTCNPCLEKYDLQRTVKSIVARSCSEQAPSDLRSRVMVQLRQAQIRMRHEA